MNTSKHIFKSYYRFIFRTQSFLFLETKQSYTILLLNASHKFTIGCLFLLNMYRKFYVITFDQTVHHKFSNFFFVPVIKGNEQLAWKATMSIYISSLSYQQDLPWMNIICLPLTQHLFLRSFVDREGSMKYAKVVNLWRKCIRCIQSL